jgi:hypothetical protein
MKTYEPIISQSDKKDQQKKQFKSELMDVFRKFGYLSDHKDHEITIKTTSGNIAWININSIEVIK